MKTDTRDTGRIRFTFQALIVVTTKNIPTPENYAILGYYRTSSGDFLPTFRDNLPFSSSGSQDSSTPEITHLKANPAKPTKTELRAFHAIRQPLVHLTFPRHGKYFWERHKNRVIIKGVACCNGFTVVVLGFWCDANGNISFCEKNSNLKDAWVLNP